MVFNQVRFSALLRLSARMVLVLLVGFCLITILDAGTKVRCHGCGRSISGRYLRDSSGHVYCSKSCYKKAMEKTLPKCAICGKRCNGGFRKDGKVYCSKPCLAKTFPVCNRCGKRDAQGVVAGPDKLFFCRTCANRPPCFCCRMPGAEGKLKDGRAICNQCKQSAVMDLATAQKLFNKVRLAMKDKLGLETDHKIDFKLVDAQVLERRSTNYAPGFELGLYVYRATIKEKTTVSGTLFGPNKTEVSREVTDEQHAIYALYGITSRKLLEVLAHELAHDWMQARYPGIKDLKVKEGWAEYVASRMNIEFGNKDLNERMHRNPDPTYGEGFRMIYGIAAKKGNEGLEELFRQYSK